MNSARAYETGMGDCGIDGFFGDVFSAVKSVAAPALTFVGGAVGTVVAPGLGTAVGAALGGKLGGAISSSGGGGGGGSAPAAPRSTGPSAAYLASLKRPLNTGKTGYPSVVYSKPPAKPAPKMSFTSSMARSLSKAVVAKPAASASAPMSTTTKIVIAGASVGALGTIGILAWQIMRPH